MAYWYDSNIHLHIAWSVISLSPPPLHNIKWNKSDLLTASVFKPVSTKNNLAGFEGSAYSPTKAAMFMRLTKSGNYTFLMKSTFQVKERGGQAGGLTFI